MSLKIAYYLAIICSWTAAMLVLGVLFKANYLLFMWGWNLL